MIADFEIILRLTKACTLTACEPHYPISAFFVCAREKILDQPEARLQWQSDCDRVLLMKSGSVFSFPGLCLVGIATMMVGVLVFSHSMSHVAENVWLMNR